MQRKIEGVQLDNNMLNREIFNLEAKITDVMNMEDSWATSWRIDLPRSTMTPTWWKAASKASFKTQLRSSRNSSRFRKRPGAIWRPMQNSEHPYRGQQELIELDETVKKSIGGVRGGQDHR